MATQRIDTASVLKIEVEAGMSVNGTTRYASRTFSGMNPELTDEDFLAIGEKLGSLQSRKIGDIRRSDTSTLVTG